MALERIHSLSVRFMCSGSVREGSSPSNDNCTKKAPKLRWSAKVFGHARNVESFCLGQAGVNIDSIC